VWVDVAAGESSKSLAWYGNVCDELIGHGVDRGSAIVAIGGGVIGDLAGFVAATLFRGIPIVHVPTTIVAMTDSAIGGKTAIDVAAGKNLVGAFWQPRLVATHLGFLRTLPARERRAGFGELWKYAVLDGPALWSAIEALAPWAMAGDGTPPPPAAADVIRRAAAYKAWVVGQDELEQGGDRILLNLGHTVGHAIEAEHGLLHGEAVALGLVAACHVSAALGLAPADLAGRVAAAVASTGLPSDPRPLLDDAVLARLAADKKRRGPTMRFVAVREVGSCETAAIPVTDLSKILRSLKTA
jgi:shikimate kinase/3-dehydroquinate synthase